MTELHAVWTSLARPVVEDRPAMAFNDEILLAGWRNAPDKGAYTDRLPTCEAARLCDLLATEAGGRRGKPVTTRQKRLS